MKRCIQYLIEANTALIKNRIESNSDILISREDICYDDRWEKKVTTWKPQQSQQVFSFKGQILAFVQYIQWPE